jgi:ABC-type multidrug transport system fused ATPase/permease subunit
MFSGTLRFNLDPFNAYADDQIWRALELAQLKRTVEEFDGQLEYKCSESGKNFRQLSFSRFFF